MSDPLLQELRVRFRETTAQRLREMESLLDALDRNIDDGIALQGLARHIHALAGLGATYGFPRVSQVGEAAEAEIYPLSRDRKSPSPDQLACWRKLVDDVRHDIREAPEAPLPGSGFDVLLVTADDAITTALAAESFAVRIALTREEALEEIERRTPAVLVVDLGLLDGCELLEVLRAKPDGATAGALVIGGADQFTEKLRAIRCGADAFLTSPVEADALVRRISGFRTRRDTPPRRILSVDDDPTQNLMTRRMLGDAGYEVAICSHPAQFEEMLMRFAPEVVLMDVHLADADVSGYELVRYVRQSERFAALPVIFVTGDRDRRTMIDSVASGGDLLITKPVDWPLLLAQIAARMERSKAIRERTEHDPLTGLLTRAAFEEAAQQRLGQAVLALLDLDHFKNINDSHGHAAGDRVLSAFGTLLRRRFRQSDIAGRYGGEEFALLLERVAVDDAVHLLQRLLDDFGCIEHAEAGCVTFSAGVAALEGSLEETFGRADAALYEAKRLGRARVIRA